MVNAEDWRCCTCLDLLFKPAVNSCGHVFCFWCFHRAMSPYTPSNCPVCRAKYGHLPAICAKLHHFLAAQFPEEYAARREETEAEERETGAQSPEPEVDPVPPPAAPGAWRPEHFACDNPCCGKLLCRPAVLNCGHCVCQPTCLGGSAAAGQQGTQPSAAAAAAAAGAPPASPPAGQSPAAAAGSSPSAAAAGRYECPACGMAARQLPVVCKQLWDLVQELFPAESRQREQEVEAQLSAAAAAAADSSAGGGPEAERQEAPVPAEQLAAGLHSGEPATPHASAAESEGSAAPPAAALEEQAPQLASGQAEAGQQQQQQQQQQQAQQQQQTLSPSLQSALRRRQAEGGPASALAQRLEENLRQLASGEGYVHHGVGCDACGVYPMSGRRYRCLDCPEAMGFDLCGDCMDRGVSNIVGRFNQRHTPQHRMQLVRPRITAMHMLQAANPELPMQQLLSLLELMWRDDDDDVGQQAEPAEQGQQGQQPEQGQEADQQQQGHSTGSSGSGSSQGAGGGPGPAAPGEQQGGDHGPSSSAVDFPMLRRGPRPAFDGHAVEPSPSAFAHWHPPAEWASARHAQQHAQEQQQIGQQQGQQQGAALGGEAQGLIDDGEEEGPAAVHVPLERVLPPP